MRVNLTSYVHKIKRLIPRLDKLNDFKILYIRFRNELDANLSEIVAGRRLILHDFIQTVYN